MTLTEVLSGLVAGCALVIVLFVEYGGWTVSR